MIKQFDSVVYSDYEGNAFSQAKEKAAKLCAGYIRKYYSEKAIPLIYLDITGKKDSADKMELAYDNLYGNALDNDTYDRSGKYYKPGIRIKLYGEDYSPEAMLKLLDYGINNLKSLKKQKNKTAKLSYYDRPKTPAISPVKISEILSATNPKIKEYISTSDS